MRKYNKLICLILAITICISLAACSAESDETETTQSTTLAEAPEGTTEESTTADAAVSETTDENSTSDTAESTTAKKKATTTKKTTAKAKDSDYDTSISLNEALDVLTNFYGAAYNVNATVEEDGWQYFAVYDKKGTKYASVKVNLSTSDAVETILATGEVNEFNLLV